LVAGKQKNGVKEAAVETITETPAETEIQQPETQIAPEQAEEDISSGELNSKITSKAKHEICPDCGTKTQIEEGCVGCKACGWALCK
jgi:hypothetical protein